MSFGSLKSHLWQQVKESRVSLHWQSGHVLDGSPIPRKTVNYLIRSYL